LLLLISSFGSVLKATLIKERPSELLKFNHEIKSSERPIILAFVSPGSYRGLKYSDYEMDRWLYKNTLKAYFMYPRNNFYNNPFTILAISYQNMRLITRELPML